MVYRKAYSFIRNALLQLTVNSKLCCLLPEHYPRTRVSLELTTDLGEIYAGILALN
jgi:hypothetical protein